MIERIPLQNIKRLYRFSRRKHLNYVKLVNFIKFRLILALGNIPEPDPAEQQNLENEEMRSVNNKSQNDVENNAL